MSNIYTLDGRNVPEPTIRQQFQRFIDNGGRQEDFAIRTNPGGQVAKIIAMRAFSVAGTITFLSREINPARRFNTTPELSDDDINKLKLKTIEDMNAALQDIATTQEILKGRRSSAQFGEVDSNLGYHTIESR